MNTDSQGTGRTAPDTGAADVVDLADIGEGDLALVGAKAYHLGMLLRAGFPVPKGFCITTHAFRKSRASPRGAVAIPRLLRQTILDAYRGKGIATAAIRSSAVDEDQAEASWAGIYPTTLRVTTERELLAAIEECFRALEGKVASLYRQNIGNGGGNGAGAMAVVVQETVEAESAGVLFTMNPMTGSRHELCINAVPGLGEPLASGRVTGDVFTVAANGRIREQRLSQKSRMLTTAGEVPVPRHRRGRPALKPRQIEHLARMGRAIEEFFGHPQDVEFAVMNGHIYVIQARPIPANGHPREGDAARIDLYLRRQREELRERVAGLRRSGELTAPDAVFSNGNIGELLPTPTPMSFGLFRHIFAGERGAIVSGRRTLGYRLSDTATVHLFELICGHAYFNVEIDAGTFDIGLPLDIPGYLERIKRDPALANYPELGLYEQQWADEPPIARLGAAQAKRRRRTGRAFRKAIFARAERFLRAFPRTTEPALAGYLERERQVDLGPLGAAALVARIGALINHLKHVSCFEFVIAARIGFFFTEAVRERVHRLFAEEAESIFGRLLQGLEGSRITEQMIDAERVAEGAMDRDDFLRRYGHLAPNELEISAPRIADDAGALDRMLAEVSAFERRPADDFRRQTEGRGALERELRRRLRDRGESGAEIDAFFAELRLAQAFLPLRETVKYYYAGEYALIRSALIALARRVGLAGEDIFYLYPEELPTCLYAIAGVRGKIARRREERRIAKMLARAKRMASVIFASDLETLGAEPSIAGAQVLEGISVAPGEAIGTVRILEAETIDLAGTMRELTGKEIIVMRSANLGVAPLFRKAAGLIIEIGGILAHGACQARESGIPAVVMENATVLLRDGTRIKVDGNAGTVSLLDTPEEGESRAAAP